MARATTKAAANQPSASKKATGAKTTSSEDKKAGAAKAKAKGNGLDKFLEEQLEALKDERATYLRQAESLQAEADSLTEDREPGDVQFDEESGEGDTLAVERERDLALSAQARAAIEEIDKAVDKIHDGTYGQCEKCGKPIPQERLKALPHAALCVSCKSGGLGLTR
jgi:RNA polymerase-binding protein DksA